jgi:hypothetical protein
MYISSQSWPSRSWKLPQYMGPSSMGGFQRLPPRPRWPSRPFVHALLAVDRQAGDRLRRARGVGDLAVDEVLEALLHEQHDEDVLVDDHARGLVIGEVGVELEMELGEELL